jgi:hypothetical protein
MREMRQGYAQAVSLALQTALVVSVGLLGTVAGTMVTVAGAMAATRCAESS